MAKLIKQYNNKVIKSSDEEDEDNLQAQDQLGYFRKVQTASLLDIYIDGPFREPAYYRQVCQAIQDTDEGDIVRFHINSGGGRLDALQSILSSIWKTSAATEAHLEGAAHSAASLLAMNCDSVYVSPIAEMLCHFIQFGTAGKAADIRNYVDHAGKIGEKLFRESYDLFLSEEEIEKCLNGYELWLDSEEIMKRLEYKFELLKEQASLELEEEDSEDEPEGCEECNYGSKECCCSFSPVMLEDKPESVEIKKVSKKNNQDVSE